MEYNLRKNSILTGENNLETIFMIKKFPFQCLCVKQEYKHSNDKYLDMEFSDLQRYIIQLKKYPLFSDMYITSHNSSFGNVWNVLFDTMTKKYLKLQVK